MNVHEWGRHGDPPLVFWHSLGPDASGVAIAEIAPVLASSGRHVLAVDAPGFGGSPALAPEDYSVRALVERLRDLVDEREVVRPVLMGHSWGAAIAVSYAGAYPYDVRALVLLDSGHLDYADLPEVDPSLSVDAWIDVVRRSPDPRRAEVRGMAMHGLLEPVSSAWPVLAEHEIPTLLYLATRPPHVAVNREHIGRFQAAVPHADIRWPEDTGHSIFADVGPPLGDEIASWLVDQGV
jgi:pimeloyl-ACP methyl ester carboxylesterase